MAPEPANSITITAKCLCGAHTFSTSVPRTALPLKASACHCTSCRHSTGALYSIDAPWPGPGSEIQASGLKKYVFSTRVHVLFCGTCGSPMFFEEYTAGLEEPPGWGVFTGVLGNHQAGGEMGGGGGGGEEGFVRIVDHIFVGDTLDGGASVWLGGIGEGRESKRWKGERDASEEISGDWPPVSSLPAAHVGLEIADIPVRCRCRGVDLVFRHGEMLAEFDGQPQSKLPWFVDPRTHKTLASFDACDSCRLALGIDIMHWTFVLLRHLAFPDRQAGQPAFPQITADLKVAVLLRQDGNGDGNEHGDSRLGTLSFYASSPDVQRYFCSRCSATVFYACDDRSDMVDLAVGLLDAPDGARAESVLSWSFGSTTGSKEDTAGGWREGLTESIEREAEAWRIKRGYPKSWRRIEREETEMKKAESRD